MPDISETLLKFSNTFQSLPQSKKISLLLVLLLIIGGPIGLFSWLNRPHYQILYTRLSPEDAGAVLDKLKEEKVSYRLKQRGTTILVPEERVHELRLQLATEKVLQKGIVGFELFDQTNLGTTEFVQTINYQRAIQGELSRTISSMAEIEWARVHLAIPQESLFIEEEQAPTASILIKLRPGTHLRKEQV
ncbi:MAG: flagellar basal-body MS-ring/collar protein FliF, partial [bacterium]